ncbi:Hypothetical predicted protein [Mytilus galloprovincialis]|uniref:Reverse transcriptase domain-containing protein n=1 Tax=Mytilus galloprovincialis TaxID=29158 RepID=A0A8B6BGF4_MYTGA|nr:Hypothetical predicted protein [Mytilus galloprovincialis]
MDLLVLFSRKKGKPKEDPGSYRKITITNPVGKLTEKLHLVRNKDNISNIQSPLQKGFTQGEIPLVAALILTELHTEAKENGNPLIIALTDAKSAFDVVWHDGLLREMNKAGLCGDNWLLFKDWYNGLNSNIKWQGQTSRTFLESQGVRQGGVWSPTAYKIFINSLLTTLETYRIGSHIGSIYVGVPTVADDVTLVSNCPYEIQSMLDLQTFHANKFRYLISSQKSCVLKLQML